MAEMGIAAMSAINAALREHVENKKGYEKSKRKILSLIKKFPNDEKKLFQEKIDKVISKL